MEREAERKEEKKTAETYRNPREKRTASDIFLLASMRSVCMKVSGTNVTVKSVTRLR